MILDLFAGPGGWDEGLGLLGVRDVVGVELDPDACATAAAAGHARIRADVRALWPGMFAPVDGLIASPPCQTFSDAGPAKGQGSLPDLARALRYVADGMPALDAARRCGLNVTDPRSVLILEPLRYVVDLLPDWLAFEEVQPVLPVWQQYAAILRELGYSVWTGRLNAANYGVPQARRRAFLLASRSQRVSAPAPTHSHDQGWTLFDERQPWVTMADALDLGARPDDLTAWAWERPATTVVRSFRPDIIAAPGYRVDPKVPRQKAPGSITCTLAQLCILQSIRADYPWHGSESTKLSLIGAVLPPVWAAAILAPFVTREGAAEATAPPGLTDDIHHGAPIGRLSTLG